MNLFHPDRPKMGTRPKVLGQQFVVPDLMVHPNENNTVTISIMLPSAEGGFSWHHCMIPVDELGRFVTAYADSPEVIFQADFHWLRVEAQIMDPHYTTQEERDNFYKDWPLPGRPVSKPKAVAPPPPGHKHLTMTDEDF